VFRNRYLMIAKNDAWRDLLRDLPWIAAYELLVLVYALALERHLVRGYVEAARLLPAAMRRRAALRAERREPALARARFNVLPPICGAKPEPKVSGANPDGRAFRCVGGQSRNP
jgi:hypothetical protein